MLVAVLALIAGFLVISLVTGRFHLGFESQPVSHSDHVWNILAMVLVGLTGVLAGGCPVRQVVLAGEGNGDAMMCAIGILTGCGLAHSFKMVSTGAGSTPAGQVGVVIGLVVCLAYAVWVVLEARTSSTGNSSRPS